MVIRALHMDALSHMTRKPVDPGGLDPIMNILDPVDLVHFKALFFLETGGNVPWSSAGTCLGEATL